MSYLEKLLNGVEGGWSSLGDSTFIEVQIQVEHLLRHLKGYLEIPYYGANNIQDYVEGYTHEGEYVLIRRWNTKY